MESKRCFDVETKSKMSKAQMLRALVKQRLTAAAEEIFGLFERTIAEYEEELSRSKQENERQRKLLDAVFSPQLQLHRAEGQQLLVVKEEVPPEQEWSSILDQEDPEPPHIKEEQEELWSSQEGEQHQGLEEAGIKFTFTPVSVKSEDEGEEIPQSSQFYKRQTDQMETGADGEDCGGPEPARNSDPDTHLQPVSEDDSLDSSETEVSADETRDPQSGLHSLKNNQVPVNDSRSSAGKKPYRCSECGRRFLKKGSLKQHMKNHTGDKPFSCPVCGKRFSVKSRKVTHMRIHSGEKPFSCSVCKKSFAWSENIHAHMRTHTGEKPYSCSICDKSFRQKINLTQHMTHHTGEKLYSCSVCNKRFAWSSQVTRHKCVGRQTHENREAEPPADSLTEQIEREADGLWRTRTSQELLTRLETSETDGSDDWKRTENLNQV